MYNMALQGLEVALTSWYWGKTQTNNSCTHLQPQTLSQEKVVTRWRWSDKVASIFSMNKDFQPSIHPLLHQSIHSLHQSIRPSTSSQEGGEVWTELPWLFCEEGFPDGSIYSTHPPNPYTPPIHSIHPVYPRCWEFFQKFIRFGKAGLPLPATLKTGSGDWTVFTILVMFSFSCWR